MTIRSLIYTSQMYSSKATALRGFKRSQYCPLADCNEMYFLRTDDGKHYFEIIEVDERDALTVDTALEQEFPAVENAVAVMLELEMFETDYAVVLSGNGQHYRIVPRPSLEPPAPIVAPAPVALPKARSSAPSYKSMYSRKPSAMEGPFVVVHGFLDAKGKDLTRKEAIAALVAMGVNFSTARTQYQRWFSRQQVAAFMAALDKKDEGDA